MIVIVINMKLMKYTKSRIVTKACSMCKNHQN